MSSLLDQSFHQSGAIGFRQTVRLLVRGEGPACQRTPPRRQLAALSEVEREPEFGMQIGIGRIEPNRSPEQSDGLPPITLLKERGGVSSDHRGAGIRCDGVAPSSGCSAPDGGRFKPANELRFGDGGERRVGVVSDQPQGVSEARPRPTGAMGGKEVISEETGAQGKILGIPFQRAFRFAGLIRTESGSFERVDLRLPVWFRQTLRARRSTIPITSRSRARDQVGSTFSATDRPR